MIRQLTPETVIVSRHGYPEWKGKTLFETHLEFKNEAGQVVRTEYAGTAVEMLDKPGTVLFANPSQMRAGA